ncbi:hypothetical protein CcaverHIS002_0603740 [Cutaneotrichosporon cavernicola]|nr:hypothetical protein CcaverHIS002_0603740 [Cutaneotrichosporon cavernicola]
MAGPRQSLGTQEDPFVFDDDSDDKQPQHSSQHQQLRTPRRSRVRAQGLVRQPDSDPDESDLNAQLNKLREREKRGAAGPSALAQPPVIATPSSSQRMNGSSVSNRENGSNYKGKGKRGEVTSPVATQRPLRDYFSDNAEAGPSRQIVVIDSDDETKTTKRKANLPPSQRKKKRRTDGFHEGTHLGSWGNFEKLVVEGRPEGQRPKANKAPSSLGPKLGEWGNFEPLNVLGQPPSQAQITPHRVRLRERSPSRTVKHHGMMARKSTGGKAPRGTLGGAKAPTATPVAEGDAPGPPLPRASATPLFTFPPPEAELPAPVKKRMGPLWATDNASPEQPPPRPLSRSSSRPSSRPVSRPASQPLATPEASPSMSQPLASAPEPKSASSPPQPALSTVVTRTSPFPSLSGAAVSPSAEAMVLDDAPRDSVGMADIDDDEDLIPPLPEGSLTPAPHSAIDDGPSFEIDEDVISVFDDAEIEEIVAPGDATGPAEEPTSTAVAERATEDLENSPRARAPSTAPTTTTDNSRLAKMHDSHTEASPIDDAVLTPPSHGLAAPMEITDEEVEVLEVPARISRREWERLIDSAQRLSDGDGLFKRKESVTARELAPAGMAVKVNRHLDMHIIDQYHKLISKGSFLNPAIHREVFEMYMSMFTAVDEPNAPAIKVVNHIDGVPPNFEFQYSNQMLYSTEVPEPELGQGCGCEGPCDPLSTTCLCVKRQQLYFYNLEGTVLSKNHECPIWECGPNCGCPPECMNRVIQRGRSKDTVVEIFKTRQKGWGVRAKSFIKRGHFHRDLLWRVRGRVYEKVGRTYLFDLDGYHISHPPDGLEDIDPRAYELAMTVKDRAQKWKAKELMELGTISDPSEAVGIDDNDCDFSYSAYSVDAFHLGAYVTDAHPERPLLVIFARFDIRPGEEMCISYKGTPDESEIVMETPRRGRRDKNKTSVQAYVNPRAVGRPNGGQCKCGMRNCDGNMFPS